MTPVAHKCYRIAWNRRNLVVLILLVLAGASVPIARIVSGRDWFSHDPGSDAQCINEFREPIDVNSASAVSLQRLPLIGPARAEAIVTHRRAHGPFASLDELTRVAGIGAGTVARLRAWAVAVRPGPSPHRPEAR